MILRLLFNVIRPFFFSPLVMGKSYHMAAFQALRFVHTGAIRCLSSEGVLQNGKKKKNQSPEKKCLKNVSGI